MKNSCILACGLALLFLTSCNVAPSTSTDTNPLALTLFLEQNEVRSFKEIRGQVVLENQSASRILVNNRLFYLPFPAPPQVVEMLILVSDASGNLVDNEDQTFKYKLPNKDMLVVLEPGKQVKKIFYLDVGFWASLFNKGEMYTIVAIYQNSFDTTKTIGEVEASSWVGSIRSNEETFIILP